MLAIHKTPCQQQSCQELPASELYQEQIANSKQPASELHQEQIKASSSTVIHISDNIFGGAPSSRGWETPCLPICPFDQNKKTLKPDTSGNDGLTNSRFGQLHRCQLSFRCQHTPPIFRVACDAAQDLYSDFFRSNSHSYEDTIISDFYNTNYHSCKHNHVFRFLEVKLPQLRAQPCFQISGSQTNTAASTPILFRFLQVKLSQQQGHHFVPISIRQMITATCKTILIRFLHAKLSQLQAQPFCSDFQESNYHSCMHNLVFRFMYVKHSCKHKVRSKLQLGLGF